MFRKKEDGCVKVVLAPWPAQRPMTGFGGPPESIFSPRVAVERMITTINGGNA